MATTENAVPPLQAGSTVKADHRKRGMIVLAIIGSIVLQFIPAWQLQSKDSRIMRDFAAFYAAGTIVREGDGSRLYDEALQRQVERERTMRSDQTGFLPYPHAPYEALLFAGLSLFSYPTANCLGVQCQPLSPLAAPSSSFCALRAASL